MRLDLFLKKTCILPQRSAAREACDAGAVRINGQPAKAAHPVQPGDLVRLELSRRAIEFQILAVPAGNVAKRDAGRYLRILREELRHPSDFL